MPNAVIRPFRPRGRFEIVVVFKSGASLHITSHKELSLTPQELIAALREHADTIERGAKAEEAEAP